MNEEIIPPPMAESEIQRIMGSDDGIVFVIMKHIKINGESHEQV